MPKRLVRSDVLIGSLLVMVAAYVRFHALGRASLWFDEVLTVHDAAFPSRHIYNQVWASGPIFYYVVHLFYLLFAKNDFWLRVPSAFFGTLTVAVFTYACFHFLGRRAALWGGLLLALSPFHILYSQELRMYTLATLELTAALFFLEEAAQGEPRWLWAACLMDLVGLYTHNWVIFFIAAQALIYVPLFRAQGLFSRRALIPAVLLLSAAIPWVFLVQQQSQRPVFEHLHHPGIPELLQTIGALTGCRIAVGDAILSSGPYCAAIMVVALLAVVLRGLTQGGNEEKTARRFFMAGCMYPLIFAWIISWVVMPLYVPSRYTLLALPGFLFPAAAAFARHPNTVRQKMLIGAGLLWFTGALFVLHIYETSWQKADWKSLGYLISLNAQRGDALFPKPLGFNALALDYYMPEHFDETQDLSTDTHRRVFVPFYGKVDLDHLPFSAQTLKRWKPIGVYDTGAWTSLVILVPIKR